MKARTTTILIILIWLVASQTFAEDAINPPVSGWRTVQSRYINEDNIVINDEKDRFRYWVKSASLGYYVYPLLETTQYIEFDCKSRKYHLILSITNIEGKSYKPYQPTSEVWYSREEADEKQEDWIYRYGDQFCVWELNIGST